MIGKEPRITMQTLKVLGTFLSPRTEKLSGAEIARETKLFSGTLYPILARLEDAGWLTSEWESADPRELGRPRRRLYQITGRGVRKTDTAIRELALPLKEQLAWLTR
jgi:PadR family transcriptional regulator PadR